MGDSDAMRLRCYRLGVLPWRKVKTSLLQAETCLVWLSGKVLVSDHAFVRGIGVEAPDLREVSTFPTMTFF